MRRKTPALARSEALAIREAYFDRIRHLVYYRLRDVAACPAFRGCIRLIDLTAGECDCGECEAGRRRLAAVGATETYRTLHAGRLIAIGPDGTVTPADPEETTDG